MRTTSAAAIAALLTALPGAALAADDSDAAILFETRLRSETVSQDGLPMDAHALTLRSRLGWRSPTRADFQFLIEAEGVAVLDDRYTAPTDPVPGRPAVPDGETLELNRAQVRWTGLRDSEVVVGRQRLSLMDGRFVGNVGWRQNEQTFDAVQATTTALDPVTLTWAWAGRVNRPLGDDHPQGVWRGDMHMLQAEVATPAGKLRGFGLTIDLDNAASQSSATWGLDLRGARPVREGLSLTWAAGYARQGEYGNNPADFGLDYHLASIGLRGTRWSLALVGERLDGDGVSGFQTPLATGHGPLGSSDVITATPAFGVRDIFVRGQAEVDPPFLGRPLRLTFEAHDFHDADGRFRLGRELDAAAAVAINPHWSAELKAARFDGDRAGFPDTSKVWLSLDYRY